MEDGMKRLASLLSDRGSANVAQAALSELSLALRVLQIAAAIHALASGDAERARTIAEKMTEAAIEGVEESLPYVREMLTGVSQDGETDAIERVAQLIKFGEALLEASQ